MAPFREAGFRSCMNVSLEVAFLSICYLAHDCFYQAAYAGKE